jgi:secondary thiamine-phosphate synthase enzyme
MRSTDITLRTTSELVTDVTEQVAGFCAGLGDGLCHLFLPHATAGLALMETGSGSEADLASIIDSAFPADLGYRHRHGSKAHGRDHVLPVFVSPSLVLAVVDGRPVLGTWQSVVVVDPNVDNPERHLLMHFLAEGS